ncbi:hypothetical protein ACSSS7_001676 [Eimeria intestinalis]
MKQTHDKRIPLPYQDPRDSNEPSCSHGKQGHVVHGAESSIVCISAGATPLHMSAAADEIKLDSGAVGACQQQPHLTGGSQPVPTALSAIRRNVSCPLALDLAAMSNAEEQTSPPSITHSGDDGDQQQQKDEKGQISLSSSGMGEPRKECDFAVVKYEEVKVPQLRATLIRATEARIRTDPTKPHVLAIILGGTICMDYAYKNTCLRPARLAKKLTRCPELEDESLPHFDVLEWDTLVDSSEIGKEQYCLLARQIEAYYNCYEGFVILHGTDTMAYTASVLSFMLENVGKPVVLTGSMLPMSGFTSHANPLHISSDAKRNVGLSLMVAAYSELAEVVVVFGSQVLRGTRVTKSNCASIDAFSSPNFPAIGSIGVDVVIHDRLRASPPTAPFRIFTDLQCGVCVIKLTPGMPPEVLEAIFSTTVRPLAVVLELYGAGTAPSNGRFLNTLKTAIEAGIAIVASTQCQRGATNLLIYENGVWISSLGVICARDMTLEAITAKLYYLMGKGVTGKRLKELMESNMRGEVTVSPNRVQGKNAVDPAAHTEIAREIA